MTTSLRMTLLALCYSHVCQRGALPLMAQKVALVTTNHTAAT